MFAYTKAAFSWLPAHIGNLLRNGAKQAAGWNRAVEILMNKSGTILVIDGDAAIGEMLVALLTDEGYTVDGRTAATATEIRRAVPRFMILELPAIDPKPALQLLRLLRRQAATRALPILVSCTDQHLVEELAEQLRQLDCNTILKPFEIDTLLAHIAQAFGTHRPGAACDCFEQGQNIWT